MWFLYGSDMFSYQGFDFTNHKGTTWQSSSRCSGVTAHAFKVIGSKFRVVGFLLAVSTWLGMGCWGPCACREALRASSLLYALIHTMLVT